MSTKQLTDVSGAHQRRGLAVRSVYQVHACPTLEVAGAPIPAGDKVMMLRNDRKVGVSNGNRGVVLDVDPEAHTMRVRLARGDVEIPSRYVDAATSVSRMR